MEAMPGAHDGRQVSQEYPGPPPMQAPCVVALNLGLSAFAPTLDDDIAMKVITAVLFAQGMEATFPDLTPQGFAPLHINHLNNDDGPESPPSPPGRDVGLVRPRILPCVLMYQHLRDRVWS